MNDLIDAVMLYLMQGPTQLVFPLQDGFSTGYTNEIKASSGGRSTHPLVHEWRNGKVDDFDIELDLAAGMQAQMQTAKELREVAEQLRNMALPGGVAGKARLDAVSVSVLGTSGYAWFRCSAFITHIKEQWMHPYELSTGESMHAKITLSMTPTYSPYTGEGVKSDRHPKRQWRFDQQLAG